MAFINKPDGTPAEFSVGDQQGNVAIGHFELTIVPSFEPGTRCGDLAFVIDRLEKRAAPNQVDLAALRGPVS